MSGIAGCTDPASHRGSSRRCSQIHGGRPLDGSIRRDRFGGSLGRLSRREGAQPEEDRKKGRRNGTGAKRSDRLAIIHNLLSHSCENHGFLGAGGKANSLTSSFGSQGTRPLTADVPSRAVRYELPCRTQVNGLVLFISPQGPPHSLEMPSHAPFARKREDPAGSGPLRVPTATRGRSGVGTTPFSRASIGSGMERESPRSRPEGRKNEDRSRSSWLKKPWPLCERQGMIASLGLNRGYPSGKVHRSRRSPGDGRGLARHRRREIDRDVSPDFVRPPAALSAPERPS